MINIQRVDADTGQVSEIIELDATLDVSMTHAMTVTEFPVESGAAISDHTQIQPASVTIRSLVSSTPMRLFSFNPIVGNARPRAAFEILEELQVSSELVRVVTDLKTYDNMALLNFTTPRRTDTKNAILFTATFREVRVVSSEVVQLSPDEDVQETATPAEEGGAVTPPPAAAPVAAEASILYSGLQGIGLAP